MAYAVRRAAGEQVIDLAAIWQSNDPVSWGRLLQGYWGRVDTRHIPLELEMMRLNWVTVSNMSADEFRSFLLEKYFPWKFTVPYVCKANSDTLKDSAAKVNLGAIKAKLFACSRADTLGCIQAAKEIPGLATAGASGLLALLFPESFATVDQFVVRALLEIPNLPERNEIAVMNPQSLRPQDGVTLIEVMRRKARDLGAANPGALWTPRMVDMALWAYRAEA